jgi:hypothetical protein
MHQKHVKTVTKRLIVATKTRSAVKILRERGDAAAHGAQYQYTT